MDSYVTNLTELAGSGDSAEDDAKMLAEMEKEASEFYADVTKVDDE